MKKKLLAMTLILGISGLTQAQTSITLYGTVDSGLGFKSVKNKDTGSKATQSGMFSGIWSSNSWGIKGSEDLGNGLHATFKLESGFNLENGEGSSNHFFKTTTLGLSSEKWGSLTNVSGKQIMVGLDHSF